MDINEAINVAENDNIALEPATKRIKVSESRFHCEQCNKDFSRHDNLLKHKRNVHKIIVASITKNSCIFGCRFCSQKFSRMDNRVRHERSIHSSSVFQPQIQQPFTSSSTKPYCAICNLTFPTIKHHQQHENGPTHKMTSNPNFYGSEISYYKPGYKNRIFTLCVQNTKNHLISESFFNEIKQQCHIILNDCIAEFSSIKFNMNLLCEYVLPKMEEDCIFNKITHQTKMKVLTQGDSIEQIWVNKLDEINNKMCEFQERQSGWALSKINKLEIQINKYVPLRGNSFIDLPNSIKRKRAIVNVRNQDEECFRWAVLSALFPYNTTFTPESQIYESVRNEIQFGDIQFPINVADIKKFEALNTSISINVFGLEEVNRKYEIVGPLYHTNNRKPTHINLLYLQKDNLKHYCWIKDMSQ
jgi:hypothetical protein